MSLQKRLVATVALGIAGAVAVSALTHEHRATVQGSVVGPVQSPSQTPTTGPLPSSRTVEMPAGESAPNATSAATLRREAIDAVTSVGLVDRRAAREAGFLPMPGDAFHWYQPDALADGVAVDPRRPEFLMIEGDQVTGVMFVTAEEEPDPPPGSPIVRWHRHEWSAPVCLGIGELVVVGLPDADGSCPQGGTPRDRSPWMFHVWFEGDDPFSAEMHATHEH